jgi:hypothetical protein
MTEVETALIQAARRRGAGGIAISAIAVAGALASWALGHPRAVLPMVLIGFASVMYAMVVLTARCPRCRKMFFYKVVRSPVFISYGPWVVFQKEISCQNCGLLASQQPT